MSLYENFQNFNSTARQACKRLSRGTASEDQVTGDHVPHRMTDASDATPLYLFRPMSLLHLNFKPEEFMAERTFTDEIGVLYLAKVLASNQARVY